MGEELQADGRTEVARKSIQREDFRIPDYQRGYAWRREQLKDFWEDLVNLSENRAHYTGVLTLKLLPTADTAANEKEFWLVDDHSYKVYHIVDGQQRLTTFVIGLVRFHFPPQHAPAIIIAS